MIEADIETEARRIVTAAEAQGIILRLLGGLAIRIHAPSATHRGLERLYADIDLAAASKRSAPIEQLIEGLGYTPDKAFNLLNGATRLLFYDKQHQRQVDIFVVEFEMCHSLPITERLSLEPLTLPLAELLLTKLQIVQLNDKDVRDILALLLYHAGANTDAETINGERIARVCADDWGLWKTVTLSLDAVRGRAGTYDLDDGARAIIAERIGALERAIEVASKSFRWKTRSVVGTRVPWYTLPEEVQRG